MNGNQVDESFVLSDGDIVSVRTFPAGLWSSLKKVGKKIKSAAKSVVSHVKSFFNDVGSWVRDKIMDWLGIDNEDSSSSANDDEGEEAPTIRGASNSSQNGKAFPLVIGKSLYTPMYIGNGYRQISAGDDGEEEYYYALFLLGYNDIAVTDIKLDELDIASNSEGVTSGNIEVDGNTSKFGDGNVVLEIQDSDEVSLYPQKVVEESLGFELVNADGDAVIARRFSSYYPQKVEIEFDFPSGLYYTDDDGNTCENSVSVAVAYSLDGGNSWLAFPSFSQASSDTSELSTVSSASADFTDDDDSGSEMTYTFTAKKLDEIRFCVSRSFSYSEVIDCTNNVVQLRIWRTTAESTKTTYVETLQVKAIRTWVFDKDASEDAESLVAQVPIIEKKRKITTRLGVKIKATDDLSGTLNKINCIVQSKCRTWDSDAQEWTTTKTATSNPAAVALELMQSNTLGAKAYTDDYFDLDSWGEFYEFCEEHTIVKSVDGVNQAVLAPFEVGGVLTSQKKVLDLINLILGNARAFLAMNGNKYGVIIDKARDLPVTILNNHNILAEGTSNSKSFDEVPDGYTLTFVNEQNNYESDTIDVYGDWVTDEEKEDGSASMESVELSFITSPNLAWSIGRYMLAKMKLRPETWTRRVGVDGYLVSVGDLVGLQDDTINVGIGDGGEILSLTQSGNYFTGFTIDGVVNITDLTQTYGVKIVQADGVNAPTARTEQLAIEETGLLSSFTFASPIYIGDTVVPCVGDICSFGVYESETIDCICSGKTDNSDGTFDLELLPYDEGVYTADQGVIPDFNSKTTSVSLLTGFPTTATNYATINDLNEAQAEKTAALLALKQGTSDETPGTPAVSAIASREMITAYHVQTSEEVSVSEGNALAQTIAKYTWYLSKDSGSTWTSEVTSSGTWSYNFDRSEDGYPEASDLATWRVKLVTTNVYGNASEESAQVAVDTDTYGTWIPNSVDSVTVTAKESSLAITWDYSAPSVFYGGVAFRYTIKYSGTTRATGITQGQSASYTFVRSTDEYPEKESVITSKGLSGVVSLSDYTVEIYAMNTYDYTITSGTVTSGVTDDSDYLTWIPNSADTVELTAEENYLQAEITADQSGVYGSVEYVYTFAYSGTTRASKQTSAKTASYTFVRATDGYPEKESVYYALEEQGLLESYAQTANLGEYTVEVYPKNTTSGRVGESATGGGTSIVDDDYLTWIPEAPSFSAKFTAEYITFGWENTNADVYGTVAYTMTVVNSSGTSKTYKANLVEYIYTFDRKSVASGGDYYPEESDLEEWEYTLGVSNGIYSDTSTDVTLDFDDYLTWKSQAVTLESFTAKQDSLYLAWYSDTEKTFGTQKYKVQLYYTDDDGKKIEWFSAKGIVASNYTYEFERNFTTGELTTGYDGYPEKSSVLESLEENGQDALGVNVERYSAEVSSYTTQYEDEYQTSDEEDVSTANYGTWVPPTVNLPTATAYKDFISLSPQINVSTATYYGQPYSFIFSLSKDSGETVSEAKEVSSTEYDWYFDRDEDGYPEADELAEWKFFCRAVSTVGYMSVVADSAPVDTDTYGTWKVSAPVVSTRASDRTITLLLSQEPLSDTASTRYGDIQYKIQVMRPDLDDGYYRPSQWYKPAASLNPYASWETDDNGAYVKDDDGNKIVSDNAEDNYKAETYDDDGNVIYQEATERPYWAAQTDDDGNYVTDDDGDYIYEETTKEFTEPEYDTGYITATSVYTQCMPLAGQGLDGGLLGNEDGLRNTTYMFKITAFNEAGEGDATTVTAVALCTSIMDIVYANEDYKELYVENLSAISSNLGVVKQGAVSGNDYNYWALSNVLDEYNKQWYRGQFRVGGEDEYLLVEPKTDSSGTVILNDSGDPDGYTITFKVGNFEVSSTATNINGEIIVMESDDSLDRTRITPTGTYYEHRETTSSDWYEISHQNTSGLKTTYAYSDDNFVITNQSIAQRRARGYDIGRPLLSDESEVYHFDTDFCNQYGTAENSEDGEEHKNIEISSGASDNSDIAFVDADTESSNWDFTPAILAVAPYSEVCKAIYGNFSVSFTSASATNVFTVDFWIQYIYNEDQVLFDVGTDFDKISLTVQSEEPNYNEPTDDEVPYNAEQEMTATEIDAAGSCVYNEAAGESVLIKHYGANNAASDDDLKTMGEDTDNSSYDIQKSFESNEWLHVAVVMDEDGMYLYLDDTKITFTRYSSVADNITVVLNELQNSFVLDELFLDMTTVEDFDDFAENTVNKIPWGTLNYEESHFLLTADNFLTDIFDSDIFKQKVQEIIDAQ